MRKHLLIAGTGRAGTSLLVRILDACGLETEISRRGGAVFWDEHAHAGIENVPVVGDDHPYVVKSPFSYQFMRQLLANPEIRLDGVLIPVRDLEEATASRIVLELRHRYEHCTELASQVEETWRDWGTVPGGVTYSLEPLDQARILAHSLHRMIEPLIEREIPIHFLKFPKFAEDLEYLYRRVGPVLPGEMSLAEFSERVTPAIDLRKVRTGCELSAAQLEGRSAPPGETRRTHDAVELPSFDALDGIALKRELKSLAGSVHRLKTEREGLLARRDALTADRDGLIAERDALTAERSALERRLAEAAADRQHAHARIDHLVGSTSWKLTRPMRTLVGRLRRLRPSARRQG